MKLKKFNDIFPSDSLLESFKGYPYKTIIVEVKSKEELEKLQLKLGEIYKTVNDLLDSCISFPNYIFLDPFNFHMSNRADIIYLSDKPDEYNKQKYIYSMKYIDQHIYNMSEWIIIESILKYGISKPSYKPKSKRVLEGIKQYPYRFKTREEFREEFGRNWKTILCPSWNNDMDEFLGKEYPFMEDEMDKENYKPRNERFPDSNGEDWAISWEMLTKNEPKTPNYKPRKLYIEE